MSHNLDLLFPHPSEHPLWIDSACFYLTVPELHLHGIVFYFFRPNLNMLTGGPVIWDVSGQTVLDCLHYNFSQNQPLPIEAQKFDFTAANSLSVETRQPQKSYGLSYDFGGLVFDLEWNAEGDVHAAPQRDASSFHAEQLGRMTGSLTLEGHTIAVDCASLRDLSYGVRDYSRIQPGAYCWGSSGQDAFQTLSMGTGQQQKILSGFLQQDDKISPLVKGLRTIEEFGQYGARRVCIDAEDALGRRLQVSGQLDEGLLFSGNTTHTVVWSLTQWDWQGRDASNRCWGDNQEFYPAPMFRKMARGQLSPEQLSSI